MSAYNKKFFSFLFQLLCFGCKDSQFLHIQFLNNHPSLKYIYLCTKCAMYIQNWSGHKLHPYICGSNRCQDTNHHNPIGAVLWELFRRNAEEEERRNDFLLL